MGFFFKIIILNSLSCNLYIPIYLVVITGLLCSFGWAIYLFFKSSLCSYIIDCTRECCVLFFYFTQWLSHGKICTHRCAYGTSHAVFYISSCCCDKTLWAKTTQGRKGFIWASKFQFITGRSQGRDSSRNLKTSLPAILHRLSSVQESESQLRKSSRNHGRCCLLASCLNSPGPLSQGMVLPTV